MSSQANIRNMFSDQKSPQPPEEGESMTELAQWTDFTWSNEAWCNRTGLSDSFESGDYCDYRETVVIIVTAATVVTLVTLITLVTEMTLVGVVSVVIEELSV